MTALCVCLLLPIEYSAWENKLALVTTNKSARDKKDHSYFIATNCLNFVYLIEFAMPSMEESKLKGLKAFQYRSTAGFKERMILESNDTSSSGEFLGPFEENINRIYLILDVAEEKEWDNKNEIKWNV